MAGVGGISLASPIPFSISYSQSTELNDPYFEPKKESLEGTVAVSTVGIALGVGGSCTAIGIGSAFGANCSGQYGLGLGWDNFAGVGAAVDHRHHAARETDMTAENVVAVWMMIVGFSVGALYLMAYMKPERNAATRFITSYLSRRWGGLRLLSPRQSMLIIAIGGVVGGVMGIVFFFREGWWH